MFTQFLDRKEKHIKAAISTFKTAYLDQKHAVQINGYQNENRCDQQVPHGNQLVQKLQLLAKSVDALNSK